MWRQTKGNKYGIKKIECLNCKNGFEKPVKYSLQQWYKSKYCSVLCAAKAKRIKDGMKDRGERYRRKKGMIKQHTPEWMKKIKATTTNAMYRPDIQQKIRVARPPLSEKHRTSISKALVGKMPANMMFSNNNYGHFQNGEYENSKGTMYFRSKWEANIALYLDFLVSQKQIKDWEYETDYFVFDKIRHGTTRYLPDFKVINNNDTFEYWEVKGFMDSRSKTKLRRMAKYYPEIKLILIDTEYYRSLQKKIGKMLNFY